MVKILSKIGVKGNCLMLVKCINENSVANFILNGDTLNSFSLRWGTVRGCPLSLFVFNILLPILATAIRQEK